MVPNNKWFQTGLASQSEKYDGCGRETSRRAWLCNGVVASLAVTGFSLPNSLSGFLTKVNADEKPLAAAGVGKPRLPRDQLLLYRAANNEPMAVKTTKAVLQKGMNAPAVLCSHGTDNVVGHGVVVGLGRENRSYASELAERGYVTFAPNYPLLAKYQPDIRALGWESGTLKAVWDNMRSLDLLESLPFVKKGPVGAIGHSLGGHNAIYTSVFDDRIKAVVSSCGLDSFLDYYDGNESNWFPEKGWCQTRYMLRLADYGPDAERLEQKDITLGIKPA